MKLGWFIVALGAFSGCEHPAKPASAPAPADSAHLAADSATAWALAPFTKVDSVNPVLGPGNGTFFDPLRGAPVKWEEKDVFNPAIVVRKGRVYMFYRAQDKVGRPAGTSRIGLAVSADGYHFTRRPEPVLYPAGDPQRVLEWEGGCEDPRIVEDDRGIYYMTYTAFDGRTARLLIATSIDLLHWHKHGSVFADARKGQYSRSWSKSGSIVSRYQDGKIVATKINGKYWMYWGDKDIWAATSDDLIHWTPVEAGSRSGTGANAGGGSGTPGDAGSALKVVIAPRSGHWDSQLVESGPPAMITENGILLIYNGMNQRSNGDTSLPEGMYGGGQVLLDGKDPTHVIRRLERNFIRPDKPYEITGQVNQVCFLEGLADFNGRWFLYYGTADSKIAVAEAVKRVTRVDR
ncbi:MAG TPA: glycoside hydrolase family 130 protein [Puia sp.]|nr:glycoside hydrolase family 130 protein [Puia sp.]